MLFRLLAVLFYAALGVLVLTFIFSNRAPIELDLFPLERTAVLPTYAALALLFGAGLVLGLFYSLTLWLSCQRHLRIARRSIAQLEQEVAAKSEAKP